MTAIWAYSKAAPGKTCEDAKLLGGGTDIKYPAGNEHGQAGWEVGLMFDTFADMTTKLQSLMTKKGDKITRLAINLHGMPGKIDADSVGTEPSMFDFASLQSRYSSQLVAINSMLSNDAPVLIMGCNVAKGVDGDKFLTEMSDKSFKGHKVVGFTTIGETLRQFRSGGFCSEPGMRDSPYDNPSAGMPKIQAEREKEVLNLPWASETSPHAKVALNGKIVSGAETPVAATNYSTQSYLPGTWSVKIGNWEGYFMFKADGTAEWTEIVATRRHQGKWKVSGVSVEWSFSDDTPGWTRTFAVTTPLKSNLDGKITINGNPHGFFQMFKQT